MSRQCIRIAQNQMIGDTQDFAVRGYDELGLFDSYYIYYQDMCFV